MTARDEAASPSVARRLHRAFVGVLLILVAAGGAGMVAAGLVVRELVAVVEVDEPLLRLNQEMLQGLTDAETGERGFLLTGDPAFLAPFEAGVPRFRTAAEQARRRGARDG